MVAQWRVRWGGTGMEAGRPARMMLQLSRFDWMVAQAILIAKEPPEKWSHLEQSVAAELRECTLDEG